MADITDVLKLDIDQALRDVQRVEAALDRALAPVELRVDDSSIRRVEDSLRDVQRVVDDTTDSVRLTADQYREVARAVESGVDPVRAIARATGEIRDQANLAEADFRDVAQALGISEESARDLAREILDAERAAERLEDASRDVARQLGLSDTEANRLVRSLRDADRAADAIDVTTIGLGSRFAGLRASAGLFAGALASIGGAAIFGTALVGANNAIQSFARLEDSINAVNVLFDEAAGAVLAFGEGAARSAGLSQEAFNQAVTPIGAVLRNFGFDAGEAADAAIILVQRGADLASVYGGTVQDALLSINSALVGQVEPLRRYGGEISQARVEAFALANGLLEAGQEMDTATTIQARFGLILQDTSVVAGDFANTAGDLANAQRTAAGEAANLGAELGEVLAPALETILALLPDVLEGTRQLFPGFAAGAESAAAFFTAAGEGGGFRTEFAAIAAGFDIATAGAGFFTDAIGATFSAVTGDLDSARERVDALADALSSPVVSGIGVNFANQLDQGTDAVDAFGDAVAQTAQLTSGFDVFTGAFRDFAVAAGLTKPQLQAATRELITNAKQLGLTAEEVDFLTGHLNALNEELDTGGRANEGYIASIQGIAAATAAAASAVEPTISAFDQLGLAAELAGVSMGEFVLSTDPIAQVMIDALDPADRLDLTLEGMGTNASAAAEAFNNTLTPAIVAARDALVDFNEDGKVSLDEFIRASEAAALANLNFVANLAAIGEVSPEVANQLLTLGGEQAALLAQGFIDNPQRILEQEGIILGTSTGLAETINDLVSQAVLIARTQGGGAAADFALLISALFPNQPDLVAEISGRISAAVDESRADLGNRIEAAFTHDDAANRAAGITADAYTLEIVRRVGASTFATGTDVFDLIEAGFTETEAADLAAAGTVEAYIDGLTDRITGAALDVAGPILEAFDIDITALGAEARSTYFDGLTTPSESETTRLRRSLTEIIDEATFRGSPPKLFLDFGEEAGQAYWSGFEQTQLNLRVPAPSMTGSIAGSTVAGSTVGGGVNVNLNINNPSVNDAVSDAARLGQIASSIATTYRSVT